MLFQVNHITRYRYAEPVSESVGELRLTPPSDPSQSVLKSRLLLEPDAELLEFEDFFGNTVHAFSIPQLHPFLNIHLQTTVETRGTPAPATLDEVAFGDARRLFLGNKLDRYLYRLPTTTVPLVQGDALLGKHFFRDSEPLLEVLMKLNGWIFENFVYRPGSTQVSTPIHTVIRERRGVCQDFAHLMLALLRARGIICRYVSGYIEAVSPGESRDVLVGAHASHAWIEVLLPNGIWWGLDPTNNQTAGERHIRLAVGRDYQDVAPLRGTYKGAVQQHLAVEVNVQRLLTNSVV